jgi:MYXO-CTERM domain-containing protein
MRNSRNAFLALAVLGGAFAWRNRFEIQRRLESLGIRTPFLTGSVADAVRSVASKARGKMEQGAMTAENSVDRKFG